MTFPTYSRFTAILALLATLLAVALAFPPLRKRLHAAGFAVVGPFLALVIALASTVGSLIYSEGFDLEPCRLCWYQRIAMYPLAVIIATGLIMRDGFLRKYVFPLAFGGLGISVYHYVIQNFPSLEPAGFCSIDVPCTVQYVDQFGFVSIPLMAAAGFLSIISLLVFLYPESK